MHVSIGTLSGMAAQKGRRLPQGISSRAIATRRSSRSIVPKGYRHLPDVLTKLA